MTSEIVSEVIGDIWNYIINKISYNKKIKIIEKILYYLIKWNY